MTDQSKPIRKSTRGVRTGNRTQNEMRDAAEYAEAIIATVREPLIVLDANLRIISANQSFYKAFFVTPEETEGTLIYEVGGHEWDLPRLRELLEEIIPKNSVFNDFEVDHEFRQLGRRQMLLNARSMYDNSGKTQGILLAIEDITSRRQIEHDLVSSELRYRRLFETAQDGILILNAQTGDITDVNPFLISMLGYSKEELVGKKLWEIGFFTDDTASHNAFIVLQNKGYIRYEDLPLETKDGNRMDVEFVSNVYTIDGEKVIQCNIRDITVRRQSERALQNSEKLYHSLFGNMLDGFAYCRMIYDQEQPQDFIYLDVNSAFEKLTGLKDVAGKRVSEVIPGLKESNPELFEIYGRVALTGHSEQFEIYLEQLTRWFSVSVYSPEKGYFVAVFDNITVRKNAELALLESERLLRDSEQRFHLAQYAANAGTWEWDLRTNKNYWSEEIWNLYGLEPHSCEPSYDSWSKTIDLRDRKNVEKAVTEAAANGSRLNIEWRVAENTDQERWLMSVGQPVLNASGRVERYIGIVIDITERKKVEQMKDDFIGLVSHELKTPITVIMGSIFTALSKGISKEDSRQLLEDAASSSESLAGIIDNLLELSRAQSNRLVIRKEAVDISKTAIRVAEALTRWSDLHNIIIEIPAGLPIVKADQIRVERVLHNLVENAIKYSPGGGTVAISARQTDAYLEVGVKDNGIGISQEDQSRLFKPFERLETVIGIGGVGLGLIVCRWLVEAHGGKIWVKSEPGKGSIFYFTLPLG
jgi:PAS domain S-box-containing protein